MARAKQVDAWNHTASVLAMIHNANSRTPRKPEEFHPMRARRTVRLADAAPSRSDPSVSSEPPDRSAISRAEARP